jgi:putative flippase GtrA
MRIVRSPFYNAIVPSAAAGPVFLLSLIGAGAYSLLPQPIDFRPEYLLAFVAALVPSTIVGFLFSYLPNAIGTFILSSAGEMSEAAREPAVWVAIGAGTGWLLALLFGAFPESGIGTFALVSTSAASAGLCRAQTKWVA